MTSLLANQFSKMCPAICTAFLISVLNSKAIEREVEFRDGSRIVLNLKDVPLSFKKMTTGNIEKRFSINLSEVKELVLSEFPAAQRVKKIANSLDQLRDSDFATRESAAGALVKLGIGFRDLLQSNLESSLDPEIRWRLRHILKQIPLTSSDALDRLRTGDGRFRCELNSWEAVLNYSNTKIKLNRSTVRAIRLSPKSSSRLGFIAFHQNDPAIIPFTDHLIDFEMSPTGKELIPGQNINSAFEQIGVSFSSSIQNSYVSVNRREIAGGSGGQSAATHNPLYEGTVKIRFCSPGNPSLKAKVDFVGMRIGLVKPGGTSLIAFSESGDEIGRAITIEGENQFLGVRSQTPISHVIIKPDPAIDSNFAFDDLTFNSPSPLVDLGNPKKFIVTLQNGDKINCKSIDFPANFIGKKNKATLHPVTPYVSEITMPLKNISIINFPYNPPNLVDLENIFWCILKDNSKVQFYSHPETGIRTKLGDLPVRKLSMTAIWSTNELLRTPKKNLSIPDQGAAIIIRNDPIFVTQYELGTARFTGSRADGSKITFNYSRIPSIWLRNPNTNLDRKERIECSDGQILYTGEHHNFAIKGIRDNKLELAYNNDTEETKLQLPLTLIRSIHFP